MRVELVTGWGCSESRLRDVGRSVAVLELERLEELAPILELCPEVMFISAGPRGLRVESYSGFLE